MDGSSQVKTPALTVDSLEDCVSTNISGKISSRSSLFQEVTVPFYVGEVALADVTLRPKVSRQRVRSISSISNKISNNEKWHFTRIDSGSTIPRKNILLENYNPIRTRNRSVSYLERFKKQIYGGNNTSPSTVSTIGSDLQDKCVSCTSYISEDKSSASEFEYYFNLTKNIEKQELYFNEDKVEDLKTLSHSQKQKNVNKLNKGKSFIVLPKICDPKSASEKTQQYKKRALEKQEDYSSQVKLRNRLKIINQKEKEKLEKLISKNKKSQIKKNITETSPSVVNKDSPPFSIYEISAKESQPKIKLQRRKRISNALKSEKINNKVDEMSNLKILQMRHEQEKNLVESLKSLALKI